MVQNHPGIAGFLSQVRSGRATVLFVFGTRPEAIKIAPLLKRLQQHPCFETKVIVTSQHRELLDQVLTLFDINPDIDLDIILPDQTLFQITTRSLNRLEPAIMKLNPDLIVIQGDTLTSFCAALAAYFLKIPVAHIEAGLRTGDKLKPFPEEMSRVLTANLADWHFAPTRFSRDNLLREGISETDIFVTGNTVVDAVQEIAKKTNDFFAEALRFVPFEEKLVLLATVHRRESFGLPYKEICFALRDIVRSNPAVHVLFSYHLNPKALGPAKTDSQPAFGQVTQRQRQPTQFPVAGIFQAQASRERRFPQHRRVELGPLSPAASKAVNRQKVLYLVLRFGALF